ncbi:hypothetical protein L9F63_019764 [Diploptera punctata]|uniref:Uncharacterized protein n=1 Tax=Diploptera punctata TaxID=6984 RepID=A0AAD8EEC9_DIPPU|nr:hypothetical protein L9F63_019764 [Diploptera punctata]
MVGTNATLIAIRLVRSKLRKRDAGDNRRHTQDRVILQSAPTANNNHHLHHNNNNNNNINNGTPPSPTAANGGTTIPTVSSTVSFPPTNGETTTPRQFIWQIPATHPYALYSNDKETLVHPLPSEQPGFCRGFRKKPSRPLETLGEEENP